MQEQPAPSVLVADDDDNLRASVRTSLEREGFSVREARDGVEARDILTGTDTHGPAARKALSPPDSAEAGPRPSLVILDISMPRLSGLDLLREIRAAGDSIPVIFLTSRDEELDRVLGLELGADDYLPKPFSLRELAARVRAVLRRADSRAAGPRGHTESGTCGAAAAPGPLSLDRDGFRAYWAGVELDLTVTEFRILDCLAERPGAARTRDAIVARAWPDGVYLSDRVVDCHVKRLRRKLREAGAGDEAIETVYGLGYRLRA